MKIMIVDDEVLALEDFEDTCKELGISDEIVKFSNPLDALSYVAVNKIDIAFLDIEMPIIKGIELAKRIKNILPNVKIIFSTGYSEYALEAFSADAVDYIMKPYEPADIKRAYDKALLIKDVVADNRVFIKTFGYFDVFVDGRPVVFTSAKSKELLAILVDRCGGVVNTEQAIGILWEGREYNDAVQSLFRKVLKSLRVALEEVGISDIFVDNRNQRSIDKSRFSCDYYDLIDGKASASSEYFGKYMEQYEWAKKTEKKLNDRYGK